MKNRKRIRVVAGVIIAAFTINAVPKIAFAKDINTKIESKKICSVSELNKLSYEELIEKIKGSKIDDLRVLFEFNKDTVEFYKDKERMDSLINALNEEGKKSYTNNTNGINLLMETIRGGFYIGNYHNELSYFRTLKYKSKLYEPIKTIINNESFSLKTEAECKVVDYLGKLIGSTSADGDIVNGCSKIVKEFKDNFSVYSKNRTKGAAIYSLLQGINSSAEYNYEVNGKDLNKTVLFKKIDGFMEELEGLLTIDSENINSENSWIMNNAIFFTGKLSKYRNDKSVSLKALTVAKNKLKNNAYQYIEVSEAIARNFHNKDYYGNVIDIAKIKKETENKYLSKKYTFDDGKFVVKAGDKVSEEKIKKLYWAANEVKAQFMRAIQNDKPLEKGNADDILTVAIYNSPEEYKINEKINGYSVNNGGIYIEPKGTFYTYERTQNDSIYTLEELFRHEYTHYLQGRYLVNGLWGKGEFYKDNLLTWYEEGTAEFFAGSTRTEGVKPRKAIIRNLQNTGKDAMDLKSLLHSTYGGWDFYNYGSAFSNYMYKNNPDMFRKMSDLIKNNNPSGYKNYINEISASEDINKEYKNNIESLINNLDKTSTPLVADAYTKKHSYYNKDTMYEEIEKEFDLTDTKKEEMKSQFFNTFALSGKYSIKSTGDVNKDMDLLNNNINNSLIKLSDKGWSGYKTLTAYFVNYKVENGNINCDVVVHGILNNDVKDKAKENIKPVAKLESSSYVNVGEEVKFDGSKSSDKDGSVVKYSWDFGDGTKGNKKVENHIFNKAGNYNVELTVTDDCGSKNKITKVVEVTDRLEKKVVSEEENNNSFKNANEFTSKNMAIKASMSSEDTSDMFSFEVYKDGEVSVRVDNPMLANLSWIVYKEGKTSNYVMSPERMDNVIEGTAKLKKGKYFINVYGFGGVSPIEYRVYVDGVIKNNDKKEEKNEICFEKEFNDSYEVANEVKDAKEINGEFNGIDSTDVYKISVKNDRDLIIEADNKDNLGMNWLLFKEDDTTNFVDYARMNGNKLKSEYKAKKGNYYLYVYRYDNKNGKYKININ